MPAYPDDGVPSSTPDTESPSGFQVASEQRAIVPRPEPSAAGVHSPGAPPLAPPFDTDRFVASEVIGKGGSSVVIRAFDKDIRRDVAIKILDTELARDAPSIDRFAEEARITGQLEHPNIVPVYDLSFDRHGQHFLSMKLVKGDTLQQALDRLGLARLEPARLAELLQVFVKVCDAVSFAHSRGVIHRDLKPKNIMVSDFGQVYVLDWGIARLRPHDLARGGSTAAPPIAANPELAEGTELDPPGSFFGTHGYMAPEQIQGLHEKVDERTDVFALGATLYQILTGHPPTFTAKIVRDVWTRNTPPPFEPADQLVPGKLVPPELSRIAARAISFDPADRYPSVEDLKRDIESFQRGAWDLPRQALSAGSQIITEGEPGSTAFVILEGRCLVYRVEDDTEIEVRVMGPGEVFGETAVISDKPRTASVRAVTDVVLIAVTREVMSSALGLNSWMGAFVKALADRFREADEKIRILERAGRPPTSRP